MHSIIKQIFFPVINILLLLYITFIYKNYILLIFPLINFLVIILKNLYYKKLQKQIILFDFTFLNSFYVIFSVEHLWINIIINTIIILIYIILPSYTYFYKFPFPVFFILALLIFFNFYNFTIIFDYVKIYLLIGIIFYSFFYEGLLFLVFIRFFLYIILFFQFLNFNNFFQVIEFILPVFFYISFFPFQIKNYKGEEILLKVILFLLEVFINYLILGKIINIDYNIYSLILLIYILSETFFYIIKNKLLVEN